MRRAGFVGRTVQLRVRFADFTTITRSKTLPDSTDVGHDIYRTAAALYDGLGLQRVRLRLVGVRVEQLIDRAGATEQLLLGARERGWRDAEEALDRVRARFGSGSVQPARLLDREDPYRSLRPPRG
jgi:DNA polymerase-4